MLVSIKKNSSKLDNKLSYNVYNVDEKHYYIRNVDGVIQGMIKENFTKLSVKQEREFKLNRILNENKIITEKELSLYDFEHAKYHVEWSGSYPNLCSGSWTIMIDQMVFPIPEDKINSSMGTPGDYSLWYFDGNYSEQFDQYYSNGDDNFDWIKYSLECLCEGYSLKINNIEDISNKIYDLISYNDWRSGSCGGCI